MESFAHRIDGRAVPGSGGQGSPVFDPSTGDVTGEVDHADVAMVDRAVQAALRAQPAWAAMPALRRARVMFRFKDLIERHTDRLAAVITAQHGKTLDDARGEIARGLEVVEFACGAPQLLKGEASPQVGTGVDLVSVRQPLGVCVGISPFNFPAMIPLWMAPVALVCGNAFVLKPSERTPGCPLLLAELADEAGLPPGLWNVVQGGAATVQALLAHPGVAAVSFVGSTAIAREVQRAGIAAGKRVQALGGAKNHAVIMPDADLDMATEALVGAAYGSAGERCMAVSVAVPVGEGTARALIERLAPRVRQLKVGPGAAPGVEMGPLVTAAHRARVEGLVAAGVEAGAELVVDGRGLRMQGYEDGFFLGGCLLDRVTPAMEVYREEIFGPVLSIVRAASFADALAIVNGCDYGNGAAIFTRDGDAARSFASGVQAGMVGVNVPIPVPMAFHSFGGWKASLFGDHHIHGLEGIRFNTRLKAVTTRWPAGIRADAEFTMPVMG